MPFTIVRQDITKMKVDAIVNAANTDLQMGGGVCGAIFKAAGAAQLQAACDKLAPIKTGEAVITPGFNLPAKFVIHAAGPVYYIRMPNRVKNYHVPHTWSRSGLPSKTTVKVLRSH
jgi:O-acetyl-ADP-ribose deacetylase (regulator of RNase III)